MTDRLPQSALADIDYDARDKLIIQDISKRVPASVIAAKYHCSFGVIAKLRREQRSTRPALATRKKDLPSKLYEIAELSILSITPDKLLKASAPQLITTAAIAIDKARLMEGLSTDNMDIRAVVPRIQEQLELAVKAQSEVIEMIRERTGTYQVPSKSQDTAQDVPIQASTP